MLMPKRVKHRKVMRGRMKGKAQRGNFLAYGEYGIVATQPGWITSNQIEAARQAMTRRTKRGGQVWIKIFPDKPVTAKPAETRMGSGKGAPEYWVAVVKPGRVLFEIGGVTEELAREALRLAAHKLPIKSKFIKKEEAAKPAETEELVVTSSEDQGADEGAQPEDPGRARHRFEEQEERAVQLALPACDRSASEHRRAQAVQERHRPR